MNEKSYPRVYRMDNPFTDEYYLRIYERPGELVGSITNTGKVSNLMHYESEMVWPWIDVTDDPEVQEALKQSQHLIRS